MESMPVGNKVESVWDYPRPPRLEATQRRLRVEVAGRVIAETGAAFRVLETSHPPTYYLPPGDVDLSVLSQNRRQTLCEWKGRARFFDLVGEGLPMVESVAWCYPAPTPDFTAITGYLSFYSNRVDRCLVDGVEVVPQPGDFYGGWITPDITGPFKGGPGSMGW